MQMIQRQYSGTCAGISLSARARMPSGHMHACPCSLPRRHMPSVGKTTLAACVGQLLALAGNQAAWRFSSSLPGSAACICISSSIPHFHVATLHPSGASQAAAAALESRAMIDGVNVGPNLSEEQLLDCVNAGNGYRSRGCQGGLVGE